MRSMEFSGRTVDEAIFHGLTEMGVTIDEVDIETLKSESKGLFGLGAKMAVVRLTEREVPLSMEYEKLAKKGEPSQDRPPRPPRDRQQGQGRGGERRGGGEQRPRRDQPREKTPAVNYDYSEALAKEIPAGVFLSGLLAKMRIHGTAEAADTADGLRLNIRSDTDGLLIGRRGETLDSIQYLVSLYINKDRKSEEYQRVTVDTEGYRARREETLKKLARRNAAEVRATGRPIAMEPMNPYERRILHSALSDFSGISTHSEGEEPNRRVVITPER